MDHNESQSLLVLVVEDEWLLREDIAAALEDAGCRVILAASGEAAMTALAVRPEIDAVVTDIRLGGPLTGWDVGEACRAGRPGLAVVYASGDALQPQRRVEHSAFFTKPANAGEIARTCLRMARKGANGG